MGLWDLLVNAGNNVKQGASGLYDKIKPTQAIITPIQQAENGGVDVQRTLELALAQPKSFKDKMLGRTVSVDSESINPETNELEINRVSKFQPGLFNDISAGAKENFVTGFAAPNWEQNKTADGRQKGLGYRIGEGLGTFGRFAESPLGRGLLMAGIVGASGGSGLEALAYGGGAGMLNQQNRMRDKVYRNDLLNYRKNALMNNPNWNTLNTDEQREIIAQAESIAGFKTMSDEQKQALINQMSSDYLRNRQQEQLTSLENEINSYRGYFDNNIYNNMVRTQQLRDNEAYRKMYYDMQQQNQKDLMDFRKRQFEYNQRQDAIENALKSRGLNIQEQKALNGINKLSSKDLSAYRDNLATLKDINAGLDLIEKNPKAYSLLKGSLPAWATNRIDPEGITTRTQIDNITAVYRKWLTGAQMSDAERKAYERFLPAPTDNYETIKAKLQGMRDSIERKNSILMQGANEYQNMIDTEDNDPLGVR